MTNVITESKESVSAFINELQSVLRSESFNYLLDLDVLLSKKTDSNNAGYTTAETLAELGYDNQDICKELLSLTEKDYYQTMIDDRDPTSPMFYVFGKAIQTREVYIKVKIRDKVKGKIFCVSFHFARYPMPKQY